MSAVLRYYGGALCPACGDDGAIAEENADATSVVVDCQECGETTELDAVSYRVGKRVGELLASPPDDDDQDDEPEPPARLRGLPSTNTPA